MADFGEFRRHWRPLLACFLGVGSALSLNSYILSTFGPYLIEEFQWSRAQWALLGMVQILVMICLPIAGRLTDLYGVRPVAAVGALSFPLFLVAITMTDGNIYSYLAIYIVQTIVCSTTTTTVYSRVVASAFRIRRGLALGIGGIGPPVIGALGAPLVSHFVQENGWRAGYYAIAIFCAICAVATLALLSGKETSSLTEAKGPAAPKREAGAYRAIFTMPVFWLMLVACFLANTPFSLATAQLKMVVLEQGLPDTTAALLVSAFAIGSIIGRVVSGVALDYLPARYIAAVCFLLPAIGLVILASPIDTLTAVTVAILLVGLSFGGEGDIVPYLVTRYFNLGVYSSVLGLLTAAMGAAMALGNGFLALMLHLTGSFDAYLLGAAACTLVGSVLFLFLGRLAPPGPARPA